MIISSGAPYLSDPLKRLSTLEVSRVTHGNLFDITEKAKQSDPVIKDLKIEVAKEECETPKLEFSD